MSESPVANRDARGGDHPLVVTASAEAIVPQLQEFIAYCSRETGLDFSSYPQFERFAIRRFRLFWLLFLNWSQIPFSASASVVCEGDSCETATFFPDVRLNYAEAVLAGPDPSAVVLRSCHQDRPDETLTRGELCRRVTNLAASFRRLGIEPGDRIVAVARNTSEPVVAALAAAAIGAAFSSCAPDMGSHAILSRFTPLNPKLLLAHLAPQPWDAGVPVTDRVAEVARGLGSLKHVVALDDAQPPKEVAPPVLRYADLTSEFGAEEFEWQRFPFNHPLFIMFSSGTTGTPKCIVHGAGGTLLEHVKEHRLHCDFRPGDRLYFHTSCAWMMWNWQLSALSSGIEIVLFDGPVEGPETLWQLVAEQRVTVFGTSPAYLQLCEGASFSPRAAFDLVSLRSILSTGSILYDRQFDWVRSQVKGVPIESISGGTDIIGCFVLGNPLLPVHRGEAQCRSLALDVRSWEGPGAAPTVGELVCANPFPSRPLGFFGDDDGSRFHDSYFGQNPPFWTHGDLIEFTPQGGARLHGRSDGVLNIRGVRVGPAEIYGILQSMDEIVEAMAVEGRAEHAPGGGQLVLLVVLREGLTLTPDLTKTIRSRLAMHGSTALVPARCVQVDELPTTFNGKRSEAAARDAVNGRDARNLGALRNPASLTSIRNALDAATDADGDSGMARGKFPAGMQTEAGPASREVLQGIVSRRLGVPVSWNDNLMEVGADSLTILQLLMEVQELVGHQLPFDQFLLAPTVEGLTGLAQRGGRAGVAPVAEVHRVRPATQDDVEAVCELLHEGFKNPRVGRDHWRRLFDYPWAAPDRQLGFVLTVRSDIVGFIGTIWSQRSSGSGETEAVCNLSSWYVRPEYRGFGSLLLAAAIRDKTATYTSLTPVPETSAMLQALQFSPLQKQRFFLPGLNPKTLMTGHVEVEWQRDRVRNLLNEADRRIFDDHAAYDLLHLVARDGCEQAYAIFRRAVIRNVGPVPIPTSELLYCSAPRMLARHFERILLGVLRRQRAILLAAHDGFVPPTVRSVRTARRDRYRSPCGPRPSKADLLYSELVLLPI